MWTKEFASKLGRLVVRGLVRWLEMLGENPPLSRDHGFFVWQALHERRDDVIRHDHEGRPGGQPGSAAGLRQDSIVGVDGRLTGYAGGLAAKRWLLDHERRRGDYCLRPKVSPP